MPQYGWYKVALGAKNLFFSWFKISYDHEIIWMVGLLVDLNFLNQSTFWIKITCIKSRTFSIFGVSILTMIYFSLKKKRPWKAICIVWHYLECNSNTAALSPQISWINVHLSPFKCLLNLQIKLESFILTSF